MKGVGWCSLKCESEWKAHHKDNLSNALADLKRREEERQKAWDDYKSALERWSTWHEAVEKEKEDEKRREREAKKQEEASVEVFSGVLILAFLAVFLGFPLWFIFFGSSS
jgi:hypothetical protein